MHIHSISKVISFPLVLLAVFIIFYGMKMGENLSVMIVVPAVLLVVIYVFHGVLDHFWLTKFPVPLDPKLMIWLEKHFPPYLNMSPELQKKFEYRLVLYINGRLFQSVGSEMREVPEDIKCMIAAHGIHMTLGIKDYLIGDIDRIFLYKHPFPTPDFPTLHHVEVNTEDGVIILSLEQQVNAILQPDSYFNIAYYAYGEAFVFTHKDIIFSDLTDDWISLEIISGWPKEWFYSQTGLEKLSITAVHITMFFSNPNEYQRILPEYYEKLCNIFNQKL